MPDLHCDLCDRPIDVPGDPLSASLDGDYARCTIEMTTGQPPSDLPPDWLEAWLSPIFATERQRRATVNRMLAEALASGRLRTDDLTGRWMLIAAQRLHLDGWGEAEAKAKVEKLLKRLMPCDLPDIDEP